MKQKTLFKIIILALCIIVLFFVFDKDNNASNNNISKKDLAFKYDKKDARLESLFDVIDNEEKDISGRVLVVNPNPVIPIEYAGKCLEENLQLFAELYDDTKLVYYFNFDFSGGTEDFATADIYLFDETYSNSISLMAPVNNETGIHYGYLPYYVIPGNSYTNLTFIADETFEELRDILDELILITKEPIFKNGDILYEKNI